jgi:hypothetical protein
MPPYLSIERRGVREKREEWGEQEEDKWADRKNHKYKWLHILSGWWRFSIFDWTPRLHALLSLFIEGAARTERWAAGTCMHLVHRLTKVWDQTKKIANQKSAISFTATDTCGVAFRGKWAIKEWRMKPAYRGDKEAFSEKSCDSDFP